MAIELHKGCTKVSYDASKTRKPNASQVRSNVDYMNSMQFRNLLQVNLVSYKVNWFTVDVETVNSLFYAGCTMEQAIKFIINMAKEV